MLGLLLERFYYLAPVRRKRPNLKTMPLKPLRQRSTITMMRHLQNTRRMDTQAHNMCVMGRELFTRYSKTETVLSYDGVEINITRFPTEEGAVFSGSLDGVSVRFNGKHHSETLQLGDDIFACEKITCIPLDAPI